MNSSFHFRIEQRNGARMPAPCVESSYALVAKERWLSTGHVASFASQLPVRSVVQLSRTLVIKIDVLW